MMPHHMAGTERASAMITSPTVWNATDTAQARRAVQRSLARPKASFAPTPMAAITASPVVASTGAKPCSAKCWRSWVSTPW